MNSDCITRDVCLLKLITFKSNHVITKGAFFWDYSGIGIFRVNGICVLLGAIPFSNERNIIPLILLPIAE